MSESDLRDILNSQLPIIDEILAYRNVDISLRPIQATMVFIEECVVEIEGDTKENYLEKKWFKRFYRMTHEWYKTRYGNAIFKRMNTFRKQYCYCLTPHSK